MSGWLVLGALPDGNAPSIQPALFIFGASVCAVSRSCGCRACRCWGRYLTETPPASCKPFFFRFRVVCSLFGRMAAAGSGGWWLLRKPPATTASRLYSSRLNRPFFFSCSYSVLCFNWAYFRWPCGGSGWLVLGALPDGNAPSIQPALFIFGASVCAVSRSGGKIGYFLIVSLSG